MKKLILLVALVVSFTTSNAQSLVSLGGYGHYDDRFRAKKFFGLPVSDTVCDLVTSLNNGTCVGAMVYKQITVDSFVLYVRGPIKWQLVGGASAGGGTPAGANRAIQFNNGGAFGASTGFEYNAGGSLVVPGRAYINTTDDGSTPFRVGGDIFAFGGSLKTSSDGNTFTSVMANSGIGSVGTVSNHPFHIFTNTLPRAVFTADGRILFGPATDDGVTRIQMADSALLTGSGTYAELNVTNTNPANTAVVNTKSGLSRTYMYSSAAGAIMGAQYDPPGPFNNHAVLNVSSAGLSSYLNLGISNGESFSISLGPNSTNVDYYDSIVFQPFVGLPTKSFVIANKGINVYGGGSFSDTVGGRPATRANHFITRQQYSDSALTQNLNVVSNRGNTTNRYLYSDSGYVINHSDAQSYASMNPMLQMNGYDGSLDQMGVNFQLQRAGEGGAIENGLGIYSFDGGLWQRIASVGLTNATFTGNISGGNIGGTLLTSNGGIRANVVTVTTSSTLSSSNYSLNVNNAANVTINLPDATVTGNIIYNIKKISNNAFTVSIDPFGSQQIEGTTTPLVISTYLSSITIQCDGTAWWVY